MSVEPSIEFSLEMYEDITPSCDHSQHGGDNKHHADGDEHYVRSTLPCGHEPQDVYVVCKRFLDTATIITCGECGEDVPFHEAYVVLGPVREFTK